MKAKYFSGASRVRHRAAQVLQMLSRRTALALLALATTALAAHAQGADAFPARPITLVVPFAPSGGTDVTARIMARAWARRSDSRSWSKPARRRRQYRLTPGRAEPPDGYTMLIAFTGTIGINPSLYANLGYDPAKDLTPIGSIATSPAVLVVHLSLPVKTLKELIAYAKANPGQLSYASSGVGTVVHVATEMLADAAGIKVEQVPYKGTGPGITDLLGGHVKMMMPPIPAMIAHKSTPARCAPSASPARSARRCCPTCPPSRKRVCPASCRSSATACWRRPARRGRSSSG